MHHATPSQPTAPATHRLQGWRRVVVVWAVWAVALAAMGGVFALYVQPDFMVLMANQVWACF